MEDRDKIIDYTKPIRLPDDCSKVRKNFTQGYFDREIGRYNNVIPSEFQWAAEDKLINKNIFEELKCQLPDSPRSTFLMVFSPDGKKVASTHGNHNVYVTDLTTGKNIQTLSGHPRTPWCIAFHPSSNQILASGCLGGQVRVWDLNGGSEVWTTESQTVIASLAFHPVDRMLVIATYNELHFWDWSQPEPFAKCSTKSEREKVRYVSFDRLGNKLITGIANPMNVPSQWDRINIVNSQSPTTSTTATTSSSPTTTVASTQAPSDQGRSITFCYRHLMNQYNQLVNRYFDLSRSRITPTIDRGTDPMDLLDLRNNGNSSESSMTNPTPSTSNSQPQHASSPLRFKITRSGSRTSRSLGGRERFRLHSSIFSRLNNRSSLPPNSNSFSTTSSVPSTRHSRFTAPSSRDLPSTSSTSQSTPRLRRCAFSLGSSARSWCLTFTPENSSNLFSTRNTSQSSSSTGAITNLTYTSYSDRGIFSTRESGSNSSGSQFSMVCPYRVLFDDLEDHQLTIHRTAQPENSQSNSNRSSTSLNVAGSATESGQTPSRTDLNTTSTRSSSESVVHPTAEGGKSNDRSGNFRCGRYRNDTNLRRGLARGEESVANCETPHPIRSFHLSKSPARNSSPDRRQRESDRFDRRYLRYSDRSHDQSLSLTQSLMHPRPVPRFQMRSRFNQDHQSQLHLITNRETHGVNLQNNQSLRRQLSFRPGGQFVLSRHSNSPFQPRGSNQISGPAQSNSPVTSKNNSTSTPEIPSLRSSFTASSNLCSGEGGASSTSSDSNTFSPSSVASNLSFTGEGSNRQLREQIKTRLFDRVKMMLRDRMRNSSEIPSIDSTVNYSQISGEPEDVAPSTGLGPRGVDPLLSSASDHRETSNDSLFLQESPSTLSGSSSNADGNGFNSSQNESEVLDLWESDSDATSFALSSNMPLGDVLSEQSQSNRESVPERNYLRESEREPESRASLNNNSRSTATEYSMRQGIQRLSLHIENMQKLCLDRIELLERQKIKSIWENLTNEIRHFQNTIQTTPEEDGSSQNDNSNSSTDLPSLRDLAISSSPIPEPSSSSSMPSTSSGYNSVTNGYKELLESMVNEFFDEDKKTKKSHGESTSSTAPSSSCQDTQSQAKSGDGFAPADRPSNATSIPGPSAKNETEEPQPGPSGVLSAKTQKAVRNSQLKNENFKFRVYKLFIEALQKVRRRRDARPLGLNSYSGSFRLRNTSRGRLRHNRHGRHIQDFFSTRSRSINRELEAILKSRKKERSMNKVSQSTSASNLNQPSTSNDSCLSCGQKKKPTRELGRHKRRSTDTFGSSNPSGSASKMLKNNTGERSRVSGEEDRGETAMPSISSTPEGSAASDNSTNELLKQMIHTMETMLQFLREAFSRTEEPIGSQLPQPQQQQQPLDQTSSGYDTDDSDSNDLNEEGERILRNLTRNYRGAQKIIGNLIRDVTQLRAKKLLSFMVKCLTQIFGRNFGNLIQVLDEQIFSLSMLLHLALQLTDLLLDQLNARSRDMERSWEADGANFSSVENRTRRTRSASDRRDRTRHLGRNLHNQAFGSGREGPSRPIADSTSSSTYDRSGTFLSNYFRRRRRTARMSTSLPSGWAGRRVPGHMPPQSCFGSPLARDVSLNGNSINNLRNFRFDRTTNEDQESYSGIRAFNYEGVTENSYNNNSHNVNDSNNNSNNVNDYRNNSYNSNNNNNNNNDSSSRSNTNNNSSNSNNNNNNNNSNNHNNIESRSGNSNSSGNNNNNYFNHFFPASSNSNNDTSNNNIIIVTGLDSDNDVLNSPGNNSSHSRATGTDGNISRLSGSNSTYLSQNPLTPLRSMELSLPRNESGDLSLRDERPILWIRYAGNSESSGSPNNDAQSRVGTFTVPVVQVNDVPVSDVSMLNQPRHRPQSPVPRGPEDIWRWRTWRPRLLHPRYSGSNPFEDQDSNDVPENVHYYRISAAPHLGVYTLDPMIITDAPISPRHRIQAWDFSKMDIPDISDREANGVVPECKIHNDASVDVSNDGHLLVTLLPSGRLSVTTMLGVYSLDWSSLGQLLYRTSFEQNAVSVSLSPTNRHLLVGLASRPPVVRDRTNMAQIFRLEGGRPSPNGGSWQSGRGRLVHMRDIEQTRERNIMSLNCIRWAPGAGQGLVYGTNTGQLKVLR